MTNLFILLSPQNCFLMDICPLFLESYILFSNLGSKRLYWKDFGVERGHDRAELPPQELHLRPRPRLQLKMEIQPSITVRPKNGLPLRVKRRQVWKFTNLCLVLYELLFCPHRNFSSSSSTIDDEKGRPSFSRKNPRRYLKPSVHSSCD